MSESEVYDPYVIATPNAERYGISAEFDLRYKQWKRERVEDVASYFQQTGGRASGDLSVQARHAFSIGGTAASAIVGYNRYTSAQQVYETMTGPLKFSEGNYLTERGKCLEEAIARRAARLLNGRVYLPRYSTNLEGGAYNDVAWMREINGNKTTVLRDVYDFSFASCQIDALITDLRDDGSYTICECKTANHNPRRQGQIAQGVQGAQGAQYLWGKGLVLNDYGDPIEDQETNERGWPVIPEHYYYQVQWQLLVLRMIQGDGYKDIHNRLYQRYNVDYAYLAVDIAGSSDIRLYKIKADAEAQILMLTSCLFFLKHNVMAGQPPERAVSILPDLAPADAEHGILTADANFLADYDKYRNLLAQGKAYTAQAETLKEQMVERLGANGLEIRDPTTEEVLLRRSFYERSSFDSKGLANQNPDIYRKYLTKKRITRITVAA